MFFFAFPTIGCITQIKHLGLIGCVLSQVSFVHVTQNHKFASKGYNALYVCLCSKLCTLCQFLFNFLVHWYNNNMGYINMLAIIELGLPCFGRNALDLSKYNDFINDCLLLFK